ncbi:hypothetical protein [Pseudolysinimonas sp.]|uniref:hypothetical protein n=1 Tax=Pseudolysinimonas sp. TaxID=2680009 RepID=UPI003F8229E6
MADNDWWDRSPLKPLAMLVGIAAGLCTIGAAIYTYGPGLTHWLESLDEPSDASSLAATPTPTKSPSGAVNLSFRPADDNLRAAGPSDFVIAKPQKGGRYDVIVTFEPSVDASGWKDDCTTVVSATTVAPYRTSLCSNANDFGTLSMPLTKGPNIVTVTVTHAGQLYFGQVNVQVYADGH